MFTCFHPHSLRDVALLWWSFCGGGGERGEENSGHPSGGARPWRGRRSECSSVGLTLGG